MEQKTYRKIEREYRAGEIIFSENDPCDGLYIINSGRVRVFRNIEGKEIELIQLGEKEMFGEMALIDEKKRSASAAAILPTNVTIVTKEMFDDQLQRLPAWVVTLIKLLVTRIRVANDRVRIMMVEAETAGHMTPAQSTVETHGPAAGVVPENEDFEESGGEAVSTETAAPHDTATAGAESGSEAATPNNSAEDKKAKKETEKLLNQLDF